MATKSVREQLHEILKTRVLIIDGAMGTEIQKKIREGKLSLDDYRGKRFADHPHPLQGNNDILTLTRPDIIKEIHRVRKLNKRARWAEIS